MKKRVERGTAGRVALTIPLEPGIGDQQGVLDGLAAGRIDGGLLVGSWLTAIVPSVAAFQIPLVFEDREQVSQACRLLLDAINRSNPSSEYTLLACFVFGGVRVFGTSGSVLASEAEIDVRGLGPSLGRQTNEPVADVFLSEMTVATLALDQDDMLAAVREDRVQVFYGTPLGAELRHWRSEIAIASTTPVAYVVGGIVVRRTALRALQVRDQKTLVEASAQLALSAEKVLQQAEERSLERIRGVRFLELSSELRRLMAEASHLTSLRLARRMYLPELLEAIDGVKRSAKRP